MYFPIFKGDTKFATLMVRASGDPNLLSLPVQKVMRGLDADLPAVVVKTMDEMMWGSTQTNRFGLSLIALFAALAVTLASLGLYGVLAYSVNQRVNELGVRIALGADGYCVTRLVIWQGMKPVLAGCIAGLAASAAATRALQGMLYQVSATDPSVMAVVLVLFVFIALLACWIPAFRATRIDPVVALRSE